MVDHFTPPVTSTPTQWGADLSGGFACLASPAKIAHYKIMTPDQQFDERIKELGDWRGELLMKLRRMIESAGPDLKLEWKWGTSIWTQNGLVVGTSAFKDHVKINFLKGSRLPDPHKLFNSGLDSKDHRSINFAEGDDINQAGIKDLVRAAIAANHK